MELRILLPNGTSNCGLVEALEGIKRDGIALGSCIYCPQVSTLMNQGQVGALQYLAVA